MISKRLRFYVVIAILMGMTHISCDLNITAALQTNLTSQELSEIAKLRSIPDSISEIILELPKILHNEDYKQDYKDAYFAIKENKRILEYDLIKSTIENALSILKNQKPVSSEVKVYKDMMINNLTDYAKTITLADSKYIPSLKQLSTITRRSSKKKENFAVFVLKI